jgi:thiamine kinase-like enzyme
MKPRPTQLPIPYGPENLTSEWLSDALQAAVSSFTATNLGISIGLTGQVSRLTLQYDGDANGLPERMIAKFPAADPQARKALSFYRIYEREAGFYRDFSRSVNLRTPAAYYVDVNPERGDSILLLEDLVPALPCDIVQGLTAEDAEQAVLHLARFHASWWESPELARHSWLVPFDWNPEVFQDQYAASYPAFLAQTQGALPVELVGLIEKMSTRVAAVHRELAQPPVTFLHGDFHPNNLLFSTNPRDVAVIDWQVCARGRGARDLMYFIATALTVEDRRRHDLDLVGKYHSELLANGVTGYPLERCVRDFCFAFLDLVQFMVTVMLLIDFSASDEAQAVRALFAERWCGGILDHRAEELLP